MRTNLLLITSFLLMFSCEIESQEEEIHGCCDELAWNFNPEATHHTEDTDSSTCIYNFEFSNPTSDSQWITGDDQTISWTGGDSNLNLSIFIVNEEEYANEELGTPIEENVPNTGTYSWAVGIDQVGDKRICFVQDINSDITIDTINDLITYSNEFSIIEQAE